MTDPQFRIADGYTYSSDQAVIYVTLAGEQVLLVIEYKPRIPPELSDIEPWHLSETLIQAFYMRSTHRYCVLHCLTDLRDFHYFYIKEDDNTYLALDKYVFVQSDLSDQAQVQAHADFLLTNITL